MSDGFDIPIQTDEAVKALDALLKRMDAFGKKADKVLDEFGKDADKSFDKAGKSAQEAGKKFDGMSAILKGLGAVAVGALGVLAINKLAGAMEGAIAAATEKEQALKGVEAALRRTGENTAAARADVEKFADELENTTGLADDTALKMFTLATSFTKSKDKAKELVVAANNLSAATGKSLESAVTALGKSLTGTLGPLDEFDPSLKNMSKAALAAGGAIEAVNKQFGGAAAAQMDTFGGAVLGVENKLDDLAVTFGRLITDNPVVTQLLKGLSEAIGVLDGSLKDSSSGIKDFINQFAIGFAKQIPPILTSLDALSKAFNVITGDTSVTDFFNKLALSISFVTDEILAVSQSLAEFKKATSDSEIAGRAPLSGGAAIQDLQKNLPGFDVDKLRANSDAIIAKLQEQNIIQENTLDSLIESIKAQREQNALRANILTGGGTAVGAPGATGDSTFLKLADTMIASIQKMEEAANKVGEGAAAAGEVGTKPIPVTIPTSNNGLPDSEELGRSFGEAFGRKLDAVGPQLGAGLLGAIQTGGQGGAAKAVGAVGSGIASLAGAAGPMAGAIGSAIEILGQDPAAFKAMIEGFVEGIPVIIDNIVENIPVLVEVLANNLGPIITALLNAIPRIVVAIIKSIPIVVQSIIQQLSGGFAFQNAKFVEAGSNFKANFNGGIDTFIAKFREFGNKFFGTQITNFLVKQIEFQRDLANKQIEFTKKIGEVAKAHLQKNIEFTKRIVEAGTNFGKKIFSVFERVRDMIDNLISSVTGGVSSALPFAKGGMVPKPIYAASGFVPRGTDTVPAMLTPGELVVPVDLVEGLRRLVGQQAAGGAIDSGATLALLARAVELLERPVEVSTSVQVRDKVFADIMLELSRRGARTSA